MTEDEHLSRFLEDKADLSTFQNAPTGPITIHEAIARAIKYNMDTRLTQMEAAFAMDQLSVAKLNMLPRLALNAGYSIRDKELASSSISYENRIQTLEPSVSSEVNRINGDISFSWSLLDFGLSYFQAKQEANRYLILMERRRRIMNNLVKEVIASYCHLASLEGINPQVVEAIAQAEEALESYRKLENSPNAPVAESLEQQRAIITILAQLRQLSTDLAIARSHLATLMNIPHGCEYQIVPLSDQTFAPPVLGASLSQLESIGVFLRPDLREESYQQRINKDEVKKEILRMFPGVNAFTSGNFDSNAYLVHEVWAEAGSRVTMDIIGLAAKYKQMKAAKKQTEVARIRRLASTVAAMLQIDMSYYHYQQAIASYNDAHELNRINQKLLEISSAGVGTRSIGRMSHVVQNVTSVNSRLDMDRRMIDVLSSWANLYFSIGCDMFDGMTGDEELTELTRIAESGLNRWLAGNLPSLPDLPEFSGGSIASGTGGAAVDSPAYTLVSAEALWAGAADADTGAHPPASAHVAP